MPESDKLLEAILDAVSPAAELGEFLRLALDQGVKVSGCDKASAFLFSGASGTLQVRARTRRDDGPPAELRGGQGIVGRAFQAGEMCVVSGEDLGRDYQIWSPTGCDGVRAVAALPVFHGDRAQGVLCFDFAGSPEAGVSGGERRGLDALAAAYRDPRFGNALWRARLHQAQMDLCLAGEGPAHQRQKISEFLCRLLGDFRTAGMPDPELAYVQLVDRRRGTIRTIGGTGQPLDFQASLSNSLSRPEDQMDVQALVATKGRLHVIAGPAREINGDIYRRFGHSKWVRLWLPLFPSPLSRVDLAPGRPLGELLAEGLALAEPERGVREPLGPWKRQVGSWEEKVLGPFLPAFGTLEIGYRRANCDGLDLTPFSPGLVRWIVERAHEHAADLYRATLVGSLDGVGRAVADVAWPACTRLRVAMPTWQEPTTLLYPAPVGMDGKGRDPEKPVVPPPESPGLLDFRAPDSGSGDAQPAPIEDSFRQRLVGLAEEAVRVAMRLDDHAADLYLLKEEAEQRDYVGTEFPDEKLWEILQEICREAAAERCTHFLFDREKGAETGGQGGDAWRLVGLPAVWPRRDGPIADGDCGLAERAATGLLPQYVEPDEESVEAPVVAFPIALGGRTQVVILLHYVAGTGLSDLRKRELEGRAGRWLHRLRLRQLHVTGRFDRLMHRLRAAVADARSAARAGSDDKPRLPIFVDQVVSRVVQDTGALAGALVLLFRPKTGPPLQEGFSYRAAETGQRREVERKTTVVHDEHGSVADSTERRRAVVFPPGASRQKEEWRRIKDLVSGDEESTVLIGPIRGQPGASSPVDGSFALTLRGYHDLSSHQKDLVVELGDLIADALGEMTALDTLSSLHRQTERLEGTARDLSRATTHDDVVDAFLRCLGPLCDHAVMWLLAPGARELVARSARGKGLDCLKELAVVETPGLHPFLARECLEPAPLAQDQPRLGAFRLWTIELAPSASNAICARYASLPEVSWLLSFPLMDANHRLLGIVDCLRGAPLAPEDEAATGRVMEQVSQQVCAALERCRFNQALAFGRTLTAATSEAITQSDTQGILAAIVGLVRDDLAAKECDLFADRDGQMVLRATTRDRGLDEAPLQDYHLRAEANGEPMGEALARGAPCLAHRSQIPPSLAHTSLKLAELLKRDHQHERLAVPLGVVDRDGHRTPAGLLYVRGPLCCLPAPRGCVPQKSGYFTPDHVRWATDSAVVVHRVATLARLVEDQAWLVDELQHALGQPLQGLRDLMNETFAAIARREMGSSDVGRRKHRLDLAFDVVHEARNRLSIYAKMSGPGVVPARSAVSLKRLVEDCCQVMERSAVARKCKFDLHLQPIGEIWADQVLLRTAVMNLIENAIKYSYVGKDILVTLAETDAISLTVDNFGVGIPLSDLTRIFQPYYRSRVPDARGQRRGSGIGLAIVKLAIEVAHHGTVSVISKPPQGESPGLGLDAIAALPHRTVFTITLHRDRLSKPEEPATPFPRNAP